MVQDIIDGILGAGLKLGSGISDFILKFIGVIIDIVLFPINSLINLIFPDFATHVATFTAGLNQFVSSPISYFAYHIPPLTKTVILLYLAIMLGYYTIIWTYRTVILIPTVINKIKFW